MGKFSSLLINTIKLSILLTLPFVVLIRGAIYFHEKFTLGPWISLAGGMSLTIVILIIYMTSIGTMFSVSTSGSQAIRRRSYLATFLLLGYCIHGLFYISTSNMKDTELTNELRDLHPIIRLAVSTVIIIDKKLVITDAIRKSSDYEKMGLPANERSLHIPQKDGYAYAIDLRTRKRSIIRNFFLQTYFRIMGFRTMKHGGTATHLHISIKRLK